jgi:putative transposase
MSFVRILVHAVWGTKYREPILSKEKRKILLDHIWDNAKSKNIHIISLGGYTDHIHCLISMTKDETIAKTIQLLKGEASNWANKQSLFATKLIWANDYFAASVSEGAVTKVKNYIANQEQHHAEVTFDQEFKKFKIAHGFGSNRL